jgi:hypothetical protein
METKDNGGKSYSIHIFRPEDGPGVAELFRTVYGDEYPVKLVYDPTALLAAFNAKENIPVIAKTENGEIIAHVALYRSAPNQALYEGGQGLVHPDFRGTGVVTALNQYGLDVVGPELGMEGVFGEAVCNHLYMQKSWGRFAKLETALEVDLMPAEAYAKERSASGRVSALLQFAVLEERPQTVYLPSIYERYLRNLYADVNKDQDFRTPDVNPGAGKTEVKIQVFDFAKVARVTVDEAGSDFEEFFCRKEADLLEKGMIVIQVWLKLCGPFIGRLTEILRTRKYFFGGLLPRWFGTDGLLMQKVVGRPNWEGIHLHSDNAKAILDMVRGDWQQTQGAR